MAVLLGKRKRRNDLADGGDRSGDDSDDSAVARALFQRAFEAKFKPLETAVAEAEKDDLSDASELESDVDNEDWHGLSAEEDEVQVVHAQSLELDMKDSTRSRELKAFMSSKIPSFGDQTRIVQTGKTHVDVADGAEADDLKNDIALQRLLKESHLLDASNYNTTGANVQGKSRIKAVDMRMQDLGAKTSSLAQKNMPLSHRRGIEAKSVSREQKRRKEAADNGIILERAKFATKSTKPREKSIGGPTVGKFKGGMLKLSGNDLRSIQGSTTASRGRKRGRGR